MCVVSNAGLVTDPIAYTWVEKASAPTRLRIIGTGRIMKLSLSWGINVPRRLNNTLHAMKGPSGVNPNSLVGVADFGSITGASVRVAYTTAAEPVPTLDHAWRGPDPGQDLQPVRAVNRDHPQAVASVRRMPVA